MIDIDKRKRIFRYTWKEVILVVPLTRSVPFPAAPSGSGGLPAEQSQRLSGGPAAAIQISDPLGVRNPKI